MPNMLDMILKAAKEGIPKEHVPISPAEDTTVKKLESEPQEKMPQSNFNMSDFFKVSCPARKVIFTPEMPHAILGMYCMSSERDNVYNKLLKMADIKDLTEWTLLAFPDRQKIELSMIFFGMMLGDLSQADYYEKAMKRVTRFYRQTLENGILYCQFKKSINALGVETLSRFDWMHAKKVLKLLPFITYTQIDDLCEEAVEYFDLKLKSGESNASN